ncbi:MAG: DUF3015 family protein [Parvularculales bacterium]
MKKVIFTVAMLVASTLAISTGAIAQTASEMKRGNINPFTQCGIGGAVFPNVPVAAAISNVIWDIGTTASSSMVFSPQTCYGRRLEAAVIINKTLPELEKDIAMGEGEYLTALTSTINCDGMTSYKFNANLREAYSDVTLDVTYDSKSHVQRASDMYDTVRLVTSEFEGCSTIL